MKAGREREEKRLILRLPWRSIGVSAAFVVVFAIGVPLFLSRPLPSAAKPRGSSGTAALLAELALPAPDPILPAFAFQRDPLRKYTEEDVAKAWFDPKKADLHELSRKNTESLEAALEAAE